MRPLVMSMLLSLLVNGQAEAKDILGYPQERVWSHLNNTFCPEQEDWCTDPVFYPDQAVLNAVTKHDDELKKLLLQNDFSLRSPFDSDEEEFYDEESDEFVNMCDITTGSLRPRAAKNNDGNLEVLPRCHCPKYQCAAYPIKRLESVIMNV